MQKFIILLVSLISFNACMPRENHYASVDAYPTPVTENLWLDYTPERSIFKVWSPAAEQVILRLYEKGDGDCLVDQYELKYKDNGVWELRIAKDLIGVYYTFEIILNGIPAGETPGIYAKAVGVNGQRAMICSPADYNPAGWEKDQWVNLASPNAAVLYELHLRDLNIDSASGAAFPAKYLGLTERGTKTREGLASGLDHLIELGITHVHLLPVFDHQSIDETRLSEPQYNWGYDPQNYNVPEGSFATDPYQAEIRIHEFKQMVKALHDAGIGVIMDVVYNHTGKTEGSNFNLECPDYYYRKDSSGHWSNASGCGNETASERAMMRKFMLESVLYWQNEYHIDGFRFDLMGIHDIETMNYIADSLREINPSCLVYGEGWTGGASPLPQDKQALKRNAQFMRNVSVFNDDLRDGIKGSVFENLSTGFVSGAAGLEESIKFGVVGAILHDQLRYQQVNYSDTTWAIEPWQSISYASCHDNHTLYDKLKISRADLSEDEIQSMQILALGIVLTSQGIPFLHAGTELLRSKQGEHNSYNLPDEINQIRWENKSQHYFIFSYLRDLIQLRKDHPAFRLPSSGEVRKHLEFIEVAEGMVAYTLKDVPGEPWNEILVIYNALDKKRTLELAGSWNVIALESKIIPGGVTKMNKQLDIPARSLFIAHKL